MSVSLLEKYFHFIMYGLYLSNKTIFKLKQNSAMQRIFSKEEKVNELELEKKEVSELEKGLEVSHSAMVCSKKFTILDKRINISKSYGKRSIIFFKKY